MPGFTNSKKGILFSPCFVAPLREIVLCTLYFVLFTFFISCDKVDYPFENPPVQTVIDTTTKYDTVYSEPNGNKRYIVIEEFTGHTCTNCPDGAREVQRIDSVYEPQIIPISIHAGYFAKPHYPPDTAYLTDFRTTEGEEYNNTFAVWGNPSAMISRIVFNGNQVLPKGDWESAALTIKNDAPKATIDIMNLYNDSLRSLKINVKTKFLSAVSGNHKLQVFLLEDHIVDWQLDGTFNNPNYDHRHVLRKVINSTWGAEISSTNANDTASFNYSLELNSFWKADDCEIVSFIYNSSTYEVIQANEAKVK